MIIQFKKYVIVFFALCLALFFRLFILAVYKIPTQSMQPTLLQGDYVIASQIAYGLKFPWSETSWFRSHPHKGDLIVFTFKSKPAVPYIKRVVAVEGEDYQTEKGPVHVGPNEVYVLSDNKAILEDSRDLGLVSVGDIESQAQMIWFSISAEEGIRWKRILTFL